MKNPGDAIASPPDGADRRRVGAACAAVRRGMGDAGGAGPARGGLS